MTDHDEPSTAKPGTALVLSPGGFVSERMLRYARSILVSETAAQAAAQAVAAASPAVAVLARQQDVLRIATAALPRFEINALLRAELARLAVLVPPPSALLLTNHFSKTVAAFQRHVAASLHQWSDLAQFGGGQARDWAAAALYAALDARDAVIHGEDVDWFIERWLRQPVTPWRRDAVAMVLLDDDWIPAAEAAVVSPVGVLDDIKIRASHEARNHKLLGQTQIGGRLLDTLDRTVPSRSGPVLLLSETVADPRMLDAGFLGTGQAGWTDRRLDRLVQELDPEERKIVDAYANGGSGGSWAEAATTLGLDGPRGESVRRKCKRLAAELKRQATAARGSGALR